MKKSKLFYISMWIIIINTLILVGYLLLVKAPVTNGIGIVLFVPPVLGAVGLVCSIVDLIRRKDKIVILWVLLDLYFIFWAYITEFIYALLHGLL